jgi:FlaA1/EpsC-like NDP-sugar epimerase
MVNWVLINSMGGEIFVPKIPSFNVKDLAKAVCNKCKTKITGIRPGEKLHEEMVSTYDSTNTIDVKKFYAILPDYLIQKYQDKGFKLVDDGFSYNSKINKHFLDVDDLKNIIQKFLNN